MTSVNDEKYAQAESDRTKYTDAIIASKSRKKIVVAGPGTGKTHLFKALFQQTKNNLTLTFINTLVEDLALELNGISDVKTLHGFARAIMAAALKTNVNMFQGLASVIEEDGKILGRPEVKFEPLFYNMTIDGENYDFYKYRKQYYQHYGFPDVVFAAVKYLEANRSSIPTFEQIVVDEFQDFNLLELAFIDFLSETSPIVLAGDDDQALYDFKFASPDHIRVRHSEKSSGYEPFNLPFCSRCTRVIVEAVGDIIKAATEQGHLLDRIPKPYIYFDHKDKDIECKRYPSISYARMHEKQISWFIEKCIRGIAGDMRKEFSVLIISPARTHCRRISNGLRSKGFINVAYSDRPEGREIKLLEGLKILLENNRCNLGWRIASRFCIADDEFEAALTQSMTDGSEQFCNLIPTEARIRIRRLVSSLRKIREGKKIEPERVDELLAELDIDAKEVAVENLHNDLISEQRNVGGDAAIRKIPIRISTIQGSKGLAEDYVFITHFDDQYYLDTDSEKNKVVSDQNICKFLVGITRAKKKVFLISSDTTKEPTFLKWISNERIEVEYDASDGAAAGLEPTSRRA